MVYSSVLIVVFSACVATTNKIGGHLLIISIMCNDIVTMLRLANTAARPISQKGPFYMLSDFSFSFGEYFCKKHTA